MTPSPFTPGRLMERHFISLGAGVQSSAMTLMAAKGELAPMPEAAVFADTGGEPEAVYGWLARLEKLLPFPVIRCKRSNLHDDVIEYGHSQIPCYTRNGLKISKGKRQCTKHWKIMPIYKAIRAFTATTRKRLGEGAFVLWNGISTDEASRVKDARVSWVRNRWPLIERGMSREDCKKWVLKHYFISEIPKSACVYCPYQDPDRWHRLRHAGGSEWELVKSVERMLLPRGEFLTRDCLPVDVSNFKNPRKADDKNQLNLFENECEGMCGV